VNIIDGTVLTELYNLNAQMRNMANLFIVDAQSLCALMMLLYYSVKSYTLMTGDSKLEILPLLRPFALTIIVILWMPFLNLVDSPLLALESKAKARFGSLREEVNQEFLVREIRLDSVYQRLEEITAPVENTNDDNQEQSWYDEMIDEALQELTYTIARAKIIIYAKLGMYFKTFLDSVMLIIFKAMVYIILYAKILLSAMLAIIGPLAFAVSIIPAYRDAWMNWLSKYVAVMLYGLFAYIAIILAIVHIKTALAKENQFYTDLLAGSDQNMIAYLMNIGVAESSYIVALLVGAAGMLCVPVVAHWVLGSGSTAALAGRAATSTAKVAKTMSRMLKKLT